VSSLCLVIRSTVEYQVLWSVPYVVGRRQRDHSRVDWDRWTDGQSGPMTTRCRRSLRNPTVPATEALALDGRVP
jgi:hypothetical protein